MRLLRVETACSVLAMIFKSSPLGKNFSVAAAPARARRRRGGRGGTPRREQLHEREPRDEAAYVSRVRDAALLRAAAEHAEPAYELEQEPEPERDVRGHGREYSEDDYVNAVARVEQHVAAQHA